MRRSLSTAYSNAQVHGAFVYTKQMSMILPKLYIRHEALFTEAIQKLVDSASSCGDTEQQRGLLIMGSWGMGKTTLAKDVAKALSPQTPGGCQNNGHTDTQLGLPAHWAQMRHLECSLAVAWSVCF